MLLLPLTVAEEEANSAAIALLYLPSVERVKRKKYNEITKLACAHQMQMAELLQNRRGLIAVSSDIELDDD